MASVTIRRATATDREALYRLRHAVYASELGQYSPTASGKLEDGTDEYNQYIVADMHSPGLGGIVGFVCITPPGRPFRFQQHTAHLPPESLPPDTFEVRLWTVLPQWRSKGLGLLLMYASFRWVQASGGTCMAIAGRDVLRDVYSAIGYEGTGVKYRCGAVEYEIMTLDMSRVPAAEVGASFDRPSVHWELPCALLPPRPCVHGGSVFEDVSVLELAARAGDAVVADVLDAWFPPSPAVVEALGRAEWVCKSSPPTHCEEVCRAIALDRGVGVSSILVGAGSSDLMYRCLPLWLSRSSRVLLFSPTYGEYAHVCRQVVGCDVTTADDWDIFWSLAGNGTFDMVFLVNPNNPTGAFVGRADLEPRLAALPAATRVWVDETYIDYVCASESVARYASRSSQVVVCKSLSKAYALSGLRAAYLCGDPLALERPRVLTPPWVLGMPAQLGVLAALGDREYYRARHAETAELRAALRRGLQARGVVVDGGCANFLVCPVRGGGAADVVRSCRSRGVYVRAIDPATVRVAVVGPAHLPRLVDTLAEALRGTTPVSRL